MKTNAPAPTPAQNAAATKALFAKLTAFLGPMAESAGLELRTFSITTFTSMQLAGIAVGSEAFAKMDSVAQQNQLVALLVLQTAPLAELKTALRQAAGDFDKFFFDYCFEFGARVPLEAMIALEAQLAEEMPAIEAAQVEAVSPESHGKGEKPPGN